jgi:hypothetical protein
MVEVLSYKPEDRGFYSRWCHYCPDVYSIITGSLREFMCTFIIILG